MNGSLLVIVLSCPQIGSLSSSTANQRAAQNNYRALGCQNLYFLNFVTCTPNIQQSSGSGIQMHQSASQDDSIFVGRPKIFDGYLRQCARRRRSASRLPRRRRTKRRIAASATVVDEVSLINLNSRGHSKKAVMQQVDACFLCLFIAQLTYLA